MFEVGEKVKCVNAGLMRYRDLGWAKLKLGGVYTVAAYIPTGSNGGTEHPCTANGVKAAAVQLVGVPASGSYKDYGFALHLFHSDRFIGLTDKTPEQVR